MNSERLQELIDGWQEGSLTAEQAEELNRRLRSSAEDRRQFQQAASFHALLHCAAEADSVTAIAQSFGHGSGLRQQFRAWVSSHLVLAALLVLPLAIVFVGWRVARGPQGDVGTSIEQSVATIGELFNCRLNGLGKLPKTGSSMARGHRIDLASGAMQIKFASGAMAMIYGPAIFDISSRNSGYLTSGKVNVKACNSESIDFSLETANANAVHNCTEFAAEVALNGRTRFDVSKGSLRVYIPTVELSQKLESGGSLELESGSNQIITLIESGEGTPTFRFPTIPPPSSADIADQSRGIATIRCIGDALPASSGAADVLVNGRGQLKEDHPSESLFFENNQSGVIALDLGRQRTIAMINTFSWHRADMPWLPSDVTSDRAVQKYDLYGFAGDEMPPATVPYTDAGWVLIARVNTDDFFHSQINLKRPPQQASSIRAVHGAIGSYRHLLWAVQPSVGSIVDVGNNTFYGEFDVFEE